MLRKCFSCGKPAVVYLQYVDRAYCKSCFLKLLVKRLRKELRTIKGLTPASEFYVLKNGLSSFAMRMLDKAFKGFHKGVLVSKGKGLKLASQGFIVLEPTTAEHYILQRFQYLAKEKLWSKQLFNPLFKTFLSFEIVNACKFLNIHCRIASLKSVKQSFIKTSEFNALSQFIESLQQSQPNAKFGCIKTFSWIDSLLA